MSKLVKFVVTVSESHADKVRQALAESGAGKMGRYSHCTFTIKGTGRFKPLKGANPMIGKKGKLEAIKEERIETICLKKDINKVIAAVKKAHPYEHPAIDIYPLLFP